MMTTNNNDTGRGLVRRAGALVALALFAVLWFANLDYRTIIRADEGRYAEIAREMATSGDWLTPRLNGIKYFEKPPLQYWATAAAFRVFGESEWAARWWPAATGFCGVLLVALIATALYGATAGLYAGIVLASSAGYMIIAHMATLDMGFTLFMTLALGGFVLGLRDDTPAARRPRWIALAWAAMALAVLSKGIAGIVLPLLVVALYAVIHRDYGIVRRVRPLSGALIFLAIAAPWFAAVSAANPEFPYFFFVHEHFDRFLTTAHHREGAWWYFVPMLAIGILPWLPVLPAAVAAAARRDAAVRFHSGRFLVLWAVAIFLFFSASHSKLPSYILPIFPALAVVLGGHLARSRSALLRTLAAVTFLIGVALVAGSPAVVRAGRNAADALLFAAYAPWIRAAGACAAAGALIAWFILRRRRPAAMLALGLGALLAEQALMMGHDELAPRSSSYALVQQMRPHLRPGAPLYSVGAYDPTVTFYAKRTAMLVAFDGEMAYGLKQEPHLWINAFDAFKPVWNHERYAVAVMPPEVYDHLLREGLAMKEIARDNRLVAVVTAGAAR